MILDNTNIFSDAQAITATARSTNVIDLGAAGTAFGHAAAVGRDIGKGTEVQVTCNVVEAFNNLTSLKISLESDDNAAFASAKEIASRTYLLAEINSAKILSFPAEIPEGADERYISLNYTVTGTAPTTGKITCGVVAARQTQ
jgi:hypothetical protein